METGDGRSEFGVNNTCGMTYIHVAHYISFHVFSLDGTYNATYTIEAGTKYNLSISYGTETLAASSTVDVIPSTVYPPSSVIDGFNRNGVVKGYDIALTLTLRDSF